MASRGPRGGGGPPAGAARAGHPLRGGGAGSPPGRARGRRRAVVARVLELRHVQELRGARGHVPETGRGHVRDLRWETRLLAISGGQVGSSFALKQALGAAVGGIVAALLARSDYRRWQRWAWPVLALAGVLPPGVV